MSLVRALRFTREAALWSAALAGVICLLGLLGGLAFGLRPLLFDSGSMAPTIHTGDISISRSTPARDLKPGDIVSVITADDTRVTHRVVATSGQGNARFLVLKGDANDTVDIQRYSVSSADKVLFTVPKVGYVVDWLSHAPGVYLLAAYVALMLTLLARPQQPAKPEPDVPERSEPWDWSVVGTLTAEGVEAPAAEDAEPAAGPSGATSGPRHRGRTTRVLVAAVSLALVAVVVSSLPSWAAWVDTVAVNSTTLTSVTVSAPTVTCTKGNSIVTMNWAAVSGATGYTLHYGASGATTESVTSATLSKVFNVNGQSGTFTVNANFGSWTSVASNAKTYVVGSGVGNTSCV